MKIPTSNGTTTSNTPKRRVGVYYKGWSRQEGGRGACSNQMGGSAAPHSLSWQSEREHNNAQTRPRRCLSGCLGGPCTYVCMYCWCTVCIFLLGSAPRCIAHPILVRVCWVLGACARAIPRNSTRLFCFVSFFYPIHYLRPCLLYTSPSPRDRG